MRKADIRRIKKWAITVLVLGTLIGGTLIYTILGPFRTLFWNLPYLGGFLGTRTYLVLLLNNYELRPAGGFITAYAKITATFGKISVEFKDSYSIPSPSPKIRAALPFEKLIGNNDPFFEGATFRDANFSPDFAESSKEVLRFYNLAYPDEKIDMVIAADLHVIESLLEIYGSLDIEDTTFTKENLFIKTQIASKKIDTHNKEQLRNRKSILTPLGYELINKVKSEQLNYPKVLRILQQELQQKHLQLYTPKSLQQKLAQNGWTGTFNTDVPLQLQKKTTLEKEEPEHEISDFLHINIANIGGRKADRYVQKKADYTVSFSNAKQATARIQLDLTHHGEYNIQSDIYQAYIRTFIPLGSELKKSNLKGLETTEKGIELNKSYFADMIKIKPGETIRLEYEYLLPKEITMQNYSLAIPKQAGTTDNLLTVTIRLPNDTSLSSTIEDSKRSLKEGSNALTIKENIATWTGKQKTDLQFKTSFHADTTAPIVLWQEFNTLQTINVRFHEAIDPESIQNLKNYSITDLNKTNYNTDTITITNARFKDRDLWLTIKGVTIAPLEQYQLTLKNITDTNGNKLDPNPTILTLVQR